MYLNVVQLAESFGVGEHTVDGWIREDGLPCMRDGGRLLFDRGQVVAWAAERGMAAKAGFLAPMHGSAGAGRLGALLRAGGIWRDVLVAELAGVLERIVTALPGATPAVRGLLVQRLRTAGGVTWAPVGRGLALPHLRAPVALGRDSGILALVFLRDALPLADPPPDDVPVTRLLFFIAPSPRAHLELLAQLSSGLTRGGLNAVVRGETPDEAICSALAAVESADTAKGAS